MESIMKKYEIKLKSNTPIVWDRMKKEIEEEKKKLKKDQLSEYEEKNWLKKAELNNGNAIIPPEWIKSMLINACKQTRMIPHYATKKNESYTRYMQGVLLQMKEPIVVCKKEELDQLGGYYPAQPQKLNSGKIWKVFPYRKDWGIKFELVDPFGRMRKEELKELLDYGGMFIGIGSQRTMNYGRFDVESVREIK